MQPSIEKCPVCGDTIIEPDEKGRLRPNEKYTTVWLLLSDNTRMRVASCKTCAAVDLRQVDQDKLLNNTKGLWKKESRDGKITKRMNDLKSIKFARNEHEILKGKKNGN